MEIDPSPVFFLLFSVIIDQPVIYISSYENLNKLFRG